MVLRAEQQGNESCDPITGKDSSDGVSGGEKIPTAEGKRQSVKGAALNETPEKQLFFLPGSKSNSS